MFGGQTSDLSNAIMGLLPQFLGTDSKEIELPGLMQMMLGMLDAQFANAPREYVYMILSMSRQMLDALIAKYAPDIAQPVEVGAEIPSGFEAVTANEDQGH